MEHMEDHGGRADRGLLRALCDAWVGELSAIVHYTYNSVLLEPYLCSVASLFGDLARDQTEQFRHLGRLLCDLGHHPAVNVRIRSPSYQLKEDADSHAPVLARRMIDDSLAEIDAARSLYRTLALQASDATLRAALLDLAHQKAGHSEALLYAKRRLQSS